MIFKSVQVDNYIKRPDGKIKAFLVYGSNDGLVLDTVFLWGVAILGGFLSAFVFKWGVYVTYIILLGDEVIKVPITLWRYRTKKWLKNVTR